jgi:hypothetical protein
MGSKHWLYTLPLRLRSIFHRPQVEHELDEELRYHLIKAMSYQNPAFAEETAHPKRH